MVIRMFVLYFEGKGWRNLPGWLGGFYVIVLIPNAVNSICVFFFLSCFFSCPCTPCILYLLLIYDPGLGMVNGQNALTEGV